MDGLTPQPQQKQKPQLQQLLASVQLCMARAAAADLGGSGVDCNKKKAGRSGFLGVTKHKRTQRYEGHVWADKKQVYLGAFDDQRLAAAAHNIIVLRSRGAAPHPAGEDDGLNFPPAWYSELLPMVAVMPQAEVVSALRTYSKSLTARPSGRDGGGSRGGSRACSRASSEGQGGDAISSGGRGGSAASSLASGRRNKRKAPTPTASVTDLESMGQRQQWQQQQAAQDQLPPAGSTRPRRYPPRPAAVGQEASSSLNPSPSGAAAAAARTEVAPSDGGQLPGGQRQLSAASPPLQSSAAGGVQPGSPLKIAALHTSPGLPGGSASISGGLDTSLQPAPLLALAAPQPLTPWPHFAKARDLTSPPAPVQHAAQHNNHLLHQLPPHPSHQQQGGGAAGMSVHLLPPVVASRAIRELASIQAALRMLPGSPK